MHVTLLGENSVYFVYNSYDIGCIKVEDTIFVKMCMASIRHIVKFYSTSTQLNQRGVCNMTCLAFNCYRLYL